MGLTSVTLFHLAPGDTDLLFPPSCNSVVKTFSFALISHTLGNSVIHLRRIISDAVRKDLLTLSDTGSICVSVCREGDTTPDGERGINFVKLHLL